MTTRLIEGTSGRSYEVDTETGKVLWVFHDNDDRFFDEGPTCSLCDGLGHGYPGGGPCPLEERGNYDGEPAWAL